MAKRVRCSSLGVVCDEQKEKRKRKRQKVVRCLPPTSGRAEQQPDSLYLERHPHPPQPQPHRQQPHLHHLHPAPSHSRLGSVLQRPSSRPHGPCDDDRGGERLEDDGTDAVGSRGGEGGGVGDDLGLDARGPGGVRGVDKDGDDVGCRKDAERSGKDAERSGMEMISWGGSGGPNESEGTAAGEGCRTYALPVAGSRPLRVRTGSRPVVGSFGFGWQTNRNNIRHPESQRKLRER